MEEDIRKCKGLEILPKNNHFTIKVQPSETPRGYIRSFDVFDGPTYNCQLSIAGGIGNVLSQLNKYHIRDLLIKIRPNFRRILLIDIKKQYEEHITSSIPPSAIISAMPYTSTNNSEMVIILIKLKSIRQLSLPKQK